MRIPFIDLAKQYHALRADIHSRIDAVLSHGNYIMGPEVKELEDVLAKYVGVKHCITAASGTEALLMSLMALNIKPGDEIITTPFTFIATVEVIVLLGAKPIFVDVESDTGNIDADLIEEKITKKTKAIITVSLYGQPADMGKINTIAERHGNLPVIEDAAQSFGAVYKNRRSCNLSTIGCTSFFPSKPLGCHGDGGAIFTNDDSLASALKEIRVHGQSQRYVHTRIGVGGRMDTLQCAVLLAKFQRFEWEIESRISIGNRYTKLINLLNEKKINSTVEKVETLAIKPEHTSVYAQYTILVNNREIIQKKLADSGIPTAIHYPVPVNEQPAYKHLCCESCTPNASKLSKTVLSLPMGPDLTEVEQNEIISILFDKSESEINALIATN